MHPLAISARWWLLACALVVSGVASGQAQPELTAPGVSQALARQRAGNITDLRYALTLSIPADRARPVTGNNLLRFCLADPTVPLVIDFDPGPARWRR